ncbi:MAG TPA: DUF308 domain-containing protein [Nitrososphaeraceae archaeon]|nr:DUF308 domain-containing protein [Nitrososphaeraceae archaeon]
MQVMRTPPWLRMLQIVLGSISVLLAAVILFVPGSSISTTVLLLSLVLLVIGIERISFGVVRPTAVTATAETTNITTRLKRYRSSRIANIALGLSVIALSIVLMEFPDFSVALLIVLAAIALLVIGIARIIHELREDDIHRATRKYFSVGIGILCISVAILIIANPTTLGLMLLVFILSVTLIIVGISMIVRGVKGERHLAKVL